MAQLKSTIVEGKLTVTGTCQADAFNVTSDKKLKKNITEFTPKGSVLDLPIYKYDFKDGDKDKIGCLAQDLKKICPELVHKGEDGFLSIEETKLVYLLIQEVRALKAEVSQLEDYASQLEVKIASCERWL